MRFSEKQEMSAMIGTSPNKSFFFNSLGYRMTEILLSGSGISNLKKQ